MAHLAAIENAVATATVIAVAANVATRIADVSVNSAMVAVAVNVVAMIAAVATIVVVTRTVRHP
jgi:hypothetical protein